MKPIQVVLFIGFTFVQINFAGAAQSAPAGYLFPARGKPVFTLATGAPWVTLGEVSLAVMDSVALGLVAGFSPFFGGKVVGLGVHPRIGVNLSQTTRLAVKSHLLYYPATGVLNGMPWILADPSLLIEQRVGKGTRLRFGAGSVLVDCVKGFFGIQRQRHDDAGSEGHNNEQEIEGEKGQGAVDLGRVRWNTVNLGASQTLSKHLSIQADLSVALGGHQVALNHSLHILIMGLTYVY